MEHLSWKKDDIVFDRYKLIKKLEGKKGVFWKAVDIEKNSPRGLKIIKDEFPGSLELVKYARETYISLLVPEHPNLGKFYSSIVRDRNVINIVEVIPGKTLFEYCQLRSSKVEEKISFIVQIIEALIHLNDIFESYKDILKYESFFHGDLHSENVIVTEDGRAVLIDWGQAYRIKEREKLFPTTAPEFHRLSPYKYYRGNKIDVFSLGVMTWNMFEGSIPFGTGKYMDNEGFDPDIVAVEKINEAKKLSSIDKDLYLVIKKILNCNPEERLTLDELLDYFKYLFNKYHPGTNQSCFLYLKKRHLGVKEEISSTAASLFEISKLIKEDEDEESLKAKIFELSIRIINENSYLFSASELETIKRDFLKYLNREELWHSIAEEKEIFARNFYNISRADIDLIHRELKDLVYQYIHGRNIGKIYHDFRKIYSKARLKHYYHREVFEVISRMILQEGKWYRKLLNLIIYFFNQAENKDFIFSLYHEFLNKSKLKQTFDPVDLQTLRLLVYLSDSMVNAKKKITKENSTYLLVLVKFLEWGYKHAPTRNRYLKNDFLDIFNRYFKFLEKNKKYIKADNIWDGIIVHYISFILSYIDIEAQNLGNKAFTTLINQISFLLEISRCRYVDFELYEHFQEVYLKLKRNFKTNTNHYPTLVLFTDTFSPIINDDFTRLLRVLKIEKRITSHNIEIVSDISEKNDFDFALGKIESLDVTPLSKKTIGLFLELKYGTAVQMNEYKGLLNGSRGRSKPTGLIFAVYLAAAYLKNNDPGSFIPLYQRVIVNSGDEISLFMEDLFFNYILFLVNAGKVGEAKKKILNLLKDGTIVKENNVVKVFRLYYLLIEILNKEKQYYDLFIYREDLKSISSRLLDTVSGGKIDTITINM